MPKTRRPHRPPVPQWDEGAAGPANRHGLLPEPAAEIDPETGKETPNPNKVIRQRRVQWIEVYQRRGKLTARQAMLATELRDASEGAANADPLGAIGNRIDRDTGCPDPLAVAFDKKHKFHRMWSHVPDYARFVVEWVVLDNKALTLIPGATKGAATARHLERLQRGLDAMGGTWGRR